MYLSSTACKLKFYKLNHTPRKVFVFFCWSLIKNFPSGAVVKNPPAKAGDARDLGSIPGSGRSPGEGNGNPLQCSCLGNPMDRRAWQATVHGVTESQTWLSTRIYILKSSYITSWAHLWRPLPMNPPFTYPLRTTSVPTSRNIGWCGQVSLYLEGFV